MSVRRASSWSIASQVSDVTGQPEFGVIVIDLESSDLLKVTCRPFQIRVPYSSVTDTTIKPETHDLYIDVPEPFTGQETILPSNVFFRNKSNEAAGGPVKELVYKNNVVGSMTNPISEESKELRTGKASTTVGDVNVAIGIPGSALLVGKVVTMLGGSPNVASLPQTNIFLAQESGLIHLMPKAFIPPFCIPGYLPALDFISQVSGVVDACKAIHKLTSETF